jgi:hypothetical protein
MTPFIVMMAVLYLRRLTLAAIGIVALILFLLGPPIVWTDLLKSKDLVFLLVGIVCLWGLAMVMTIYDHFRYQGWDLLSDPAADDLAVKFVTALLNQQTEAARQLCSTESRIRCSSSEFESRAQGVVDELGDAKVILELDVPGRFRLPILQGAANALNAVADAETSAIALVLLTGMRGGANAAAFPTVRLRLRREGDAWCIIGFDATTTALCQSN